MIEKGDEKGKLALSELTGFQGFGKIDSTGKEKINTDPNGPCFS
jgi:hypothetical protein